MKNIINPGDKRVHQFVVAQEDLASFNRSNVHPVCSTFSLAREMEWASRLFVLEMTEDDEEGIGTQLSITHHAPALIGEQLRIEAVVSKLVAHELICDIRVCVGKRLIATGVTGQKILKKRKIANLISNIEEDGGKEK
jgi:fluoroacetyl-CoA thioesterase